MTPLNGLTRGVFLFPILVSLAFGQGLNPATPTKDYIRLGGQVIAIENAVPARVAQAGLSPTSLTFASQTVGTASSAQTVTLSNSGTAALSLSGVSVGGTNAGDFSTTNNCGTSLSAGGSCAILVTFTPQAAGSRAATLSISDNAAGSPQTVALSGTGASASGGGGTPTGFDTYVGSYASGSPTYTAEPTITVPFRIYVPTGVSTFNLVQISMNATGGGGYYIYLRFNGSVWTLDMGGQTTGSSVEFPLTPNGTTVATNVAVGSLQVSSASLALAGNEIQLNLTLTQTGTITGYTMVMEATSNGPTYSQPWAGGVAATWAPASGPPLSWSGVSTYTYAGTNVGAVSASQTFTLKNGSGSAVSVSSIATTGANPDDFSIRSNECPASLAAGSSCAVIVDFEPAAAGNREAVLQVVNSGAGSPESVALSGVGDGSELPPSVMTTYVGVWGDPTPAYNGSTVMLPFRIYSPNGFSTFTLLQIVLNAPSASAPGGGGFYIYLRSNGSTYSVDMGGQANGSGSAPSSTFFLTPNGQTVAANFGVSVLQVVSARLGLVGNELQLDLTLAQTGTISYQIQMDAQASGGVYSKPWLGVAAATWGN